ncbi:hypothetical protein BCR44DRAFT_1046791 [Catenaria anguillulae PL171]|uniref:Uncharacterized protein n=1 Tax=Catenaria anguillulae PL171 TaxID=765915 RepID=A0A1Y2H5A6_9FUNG|nr:hypothetical protein BCR44DRAFT_1046791 [Catenaria anguillulae PL171]
MTLPSSTKPTGHALDLPLTRSTQAPIHQHHRYLLLLASIVPPTCVTRPPPLLTRLGRCPLWRRQQPRRQCRRQAQRRMRDGRAHANVYVGKIRGNSVEVDARRTRVPTGQRCAAVVGETVGKGRAQVGDLLVGSIGSVYNEQIEHELVSQGCA